MIDLFLAFLAGACFIAGIDSIARGWIITAIWNMTSSILIVGYLLWA